VRGLAPNDTRGARDCKLRRRCLTPAVIGIEVEMLCAELEDLEAQFDKIVAALEDPNLTNEQRVALQKARDDMSHTIKEHQLFGHKGAPCYEE